MKDVKLTHSVEKPCVFHDFPDFMFWFCVQWAWPSCVNTQFLNLTWKRHSYFSCMYLLAQLRPFLPSWMLWIVHFCCCDDTKSPRGVPTCSCALEDLSASLCWRALSKFMPLGKHCTLWSMHEPDCGFCNQSYIIMTNVETEIAESVCDYSQVVCWGLLQGEILYFATTGKEHLCIVWFLTTVDLFPSKIVCLHNTWHINV